MWPRRDEEQVAERWREKSERGGKKRRGSESAWIPLCLTARVLILHAGRTPGVQGKQGKCWQLTERGKV